MTGQSLLAMKGISEVLSNGGCPMPSYQNPLPVSSTRRTDDALDRVRTLLAERRRADAPVESIEEFERVSRALVMDLEREIVAEELGRLDVDVPEVTIDGVEHRRVGRWAQSYVSAAGEMRVERTLYVPRGGGSDAVSPMELRAGIVEGTWTPLAARQATWAVAHLTPQESEGFFREIGAMTPSKSSLDRLPKLLSDRWEKRREEFESELRSGRAERVDPSTRTVVVSLDGVLVPMKDGGKDKTRTKTEQAGKRVGGPAGFREVGCGTVSVHDGEGERLRTVRMARMPEQNKPTLASQLRAEVASILDRRPDLPLVKVADGARTNWDLLGEGFPEGTEVVDFFHAAEHLKKALDLAYGETSPRSRAQFEKLRLVLRDDNLGVEKVIRALAHLVDRFPRRQKLRTELRYFRKNRRRMRYAEFAALKIPIGSGVVEAACKTLATARMKRSGMRWRHAGGQAILTFRALQQSDRWDRGWSLVAATYVHKVALPSNVIPLRKVA